jgi:hypothetical protein
MMAVAGSMSVAGSHEDNIAGSFGGYAAAAAASAAGAEAGHSGPILPLPRAVALAPAATILPSVKTPLIELADSLGGVR